MAAVTTMPASGEWTVDDLDRLPDDGLRYELVDGVLLVSPSPKVLHQLGLTRLVVALSTGAPDELRVLAAPLDVTFSRTRRLQPDIVVVHADQTKGLTLQGIPLLAVEVLSPTTQATDTTLKRHVFEQAGVPSYWLLDPDDRSLTVLELQEGRYREVAVARDHEAVTVERPFPLRLTPAQLLR